MATLTSLSAKLEDRLIRLRDRATPTTEDERRDIETLPVLLTNGELLAMGKENASVASQKAQLERDLENFKKRMKAEIEALDGKIADNNDCLNTGKQDRPVECVAILDNPKRGQKTTYRLDTFETVRTVTMSTEETQRIMRFMADKEKPKEGDKKKGETLPVIGGDAPTPAAAPTTDTAAEAAPAK